MNVKRTNNSAFTLIEVLLAAIIFIVTIGGLFVTLGSVRAPVATKQNALSAAVFGKQILEALRSQVSQNAAANYYTCSVALQNPCQDFSLSLGPHLVSAATLNTYGITWPAGLAAVNAAGLNYSVTCSDGGAYAGNPSVCAGGVDIAREATLNITTP